MIRFHVSKSGSYITGFSCEGHAGYAEAGEDIICAAVSALTICTVNSIDALTEDGFTVDQSEDGGYLKLALTDEDPSEASQLLMNSLILGMQNIQEAYGEDYVTVIISD